MRKFPWKVAGTIAAIAVLAWVGIQIYLAGRENIPLPGQQPIVLRNCSEVAHHLNTESWRFQCERAEVTPDGTIATIDKVRNGVLYKNHKPYLHLSAEHVQVNTTTLDFTATGDVHIEQISPKDQLTRSFDTDLVQWTNATKMLLLPHPSVVRSADQVLTVQDITVDFTKGQVHMGRIKGGFKAPG